MFLDEAEYFRVTLGDFRDYIGFNKIRFAKLDRDAFDSFVKFGSLDVFPALNCFKSLSRYGAVDAHCLGDEGSRYIAARKRRRLRSAWHPGDRSLKPVDVFSPADLESSE